MAVLFSGSGQPSDTEATAILQTFQQRFAALCAVMHSVVAGAGPTMQSAVNGAISGLLSSCQAFLNDLKNAVQLTLTKHISRFILKKSLMNSCRSSLDLY